MQMLRVGEYTDTDSRRNKQTGKGIEWVKIDGMCPMEYRRGRIVPCGVLLWPISRA